MTTLPLAQVNDLLLPLLLSLLTWGSGEAIKWLRGRAQTDSYGTAMQRLGDAVVTVVAELQQTLVASLKAKAADGRLSAEDLATVRDAAIARVKNYLGPKGLALVLGALGIGEADLRGLIIGKLEAAVAVSKAPALQALPPFLSSGKAPAPAGLPPFLAGNPRT
jgi:hypothetical protein